jgi:hypothetical protein
MQDRSSGGRGEVRRPFMHTHGSSLSPTRAGQRQSLPGRSAGRRKAPQAHLRGLRTHSASEERSGGPGQYSDDGGERAGPAGQQAARGVPGACAHEADGGESLLFEMEAAAPLRVSCLHICGDMLLTRELTFISLFVHALTQEEADLLINEFPDNHIKVRDRGRGISWSTEGDRVDREGLANAGCSEFPLPCILHLHRATGDNGRSGSSEGGGSSRSAFSHQDLRRDHLAPTWRGSSSQAVLSASKPIYLITDLHACHFVHHRQQCQRVVQSHSLPHTRCKSLGAEP